MARPAPCGRPTWCAWPKAPAWDVPAADNADLAGITNAEGAISSFESWTTGSLEGNVVSGEARFADIADTTSREICRLARDRGTAGVVAEGSPQPQAPVSPEWDTLVARCGELAV